MVAYVSLCCLYCVLLCLAIQLCLGMERSSHQSSSFGDINQDSEVEPGACQRKRCYHTVNGSTINLDVINHQPLVCEEFVITSPKFNYFRWIAWTLCFYALGCMLQLHLQVSRFVNRSRHLFFMYEQ